LVDRVGYLDDTINDMKKTIGTDSARIVSYYRPGSYKGSIYADTAEVEGGVNALFGRTLDMFGESQFMYLWRP
jgi:protease-4